MSEIIELTPTIETTERDKVESWRLHVLIEAGFPLPLAERVAASEADLTLDEMLERIVRWPERWPRRRSDGR
jgi:hypothetical protein